MTHKTLIAFMLLGFFFYIYVFRQHTQIQQTQYSTHTHTHTQNLKPCNVEGPDNVTLLLKHGPQFASTMTILVIRI